MNYRHAYHAGNFADVFKHVVLVRLLTYLRQKDKPFFVLDTHAGIGLYDLQSEQARKTKEAEAGIGRLWKARDLPTAAADYLALVRGMTNGKKKGELKHYPGSPLLIRALLRPQDRLVANELHPEDNKVLARALGEDARLWVRQEDGYQLLKSELPPKERRGLVLIDPPFEERDEFARMARGLQDAYERWATGIYCLWYPIKDMRAVDTFHDALRATGIRKIIAAHFLLREPKDAELFNGCGLVLVNAPWTFGDDLAVIGPWLRETLLAGQGPGCSLAEIAGEA